MLGEQWHTSTFSHTNGCVSARWRKASASNVDACVEVAIERGVSRKGVTAYVQIRDSKDHGGPTLTFNAVEWQAFLDGVRAGEFDLPAEVKDGGVAAVERDLAWREQVAGPGTAAPLYPELGDDLKRAGEQAARYKAGQP